MIPPQAQAALQGLNQGNEESRSVIPSAYQPKGVAKPQNPWKGTCDMMSTTLMKLADEVGKQGDEFRDIKQNFMKLAYEVTKNSNQIDKLLEGDDNADQ